MVFGDENINIPDGLVTDEFLIRPLLATDVELDYAAVMESKEILRKWDQSSWPADDFTLADNLEDLQRHEREHINRESLTFTVMNPAETQCLGCIYVFPLTARWLAKAKTTPIGDKDWEEFEAAILFWIRQSRLAEGMDRNLLDILRPWFAQKWPFDGHLFLTNEQFEQQGASLRALIVSFNLKSSCQIIPEIIVRICNTTGAASSHPPSLAARCEDIAASPTELALATGLHPPSVGFPGRPFHVMSIGRVKSVGRTAVEVEIPLALLLA